MAKTEKAAEAAAPTPAPAENTEKSTKSIVPSGWKSKNDALAQFINDQCTGKDGFEFTAFFKLCRNNGIAEDQVQKYEAAIADKQHGAPGRAKMTLRNMLATIARKNGELVGLDGTTKFPINLPKPEVSGAAAKAAEAKSGDVTQDQNAEAPQTE